MIKRCSGQQPPEQPCSPKVQWWQATSQGPFTSSGTYSMRKRSNEEIWPKNVPMLIGDEYV